MPYRLLHEREGFLPALKQIQIPHCFSVDVPAIFVTLSNSIRYVEISGLNDENVEFSQTFLSLLGKRSPDIHHLVLRGWRWRGRAIDPSHILAFRSLQRLEMAVDNPMPSPEFIKEMGNLGDLVGYVGGATVTTPPIHLMPKPLPKPLCSPRKFCHLKDLKLTGTISAISSFLEFTCLTNLVSLMITQQEESTDIQIERCWVESFCKLDVSSFIESVEIVQTYSSSLSNTSISPLLRLRPLKHLRIEQGSFCATDTGIFEILKSLPNLTRLSLPEEWHTFCPTITALVYISSDNPKLNELKIPLAGDIEHSCSIMSELIDWTTREHYHSLPQLHLTTRYGQLTPKQMVVFAQFLHRSFPLLSKLKGDGTYRASESWVHVHEIQLALQAEAKFQNASN